MKITLNGEPFEIGRPLTVTELLTQLDIDARRIAVERNLIVLKRAAFDRTEVTPRIRSKSSTSWAVDSMSPDT